MDESVLQVPERCLDHDAWFRGRVNNSLERLDRGEFFTNEQVSERIGKLLADRLEL